MTTEIVEATIDDAWSAGYISALLSMRYAVLHEGMTGELFRKPAPTKVPDVVCAILTNMCRGAIDRHIIESSWASLDQLLLCNSEEEVRNALDRIQNHRLQ